MTLDIAAIFAARCVEEALKQDVPISRIDKGLSRNPNDREQAVRVTFGEPTKGRWVTVYLVVDCDNELEIHVRARAPGVTNESTFFETAERIVEAAGNFLEFERLY